MSRSPDVAVIGGGIIGCSASALLAERGATVTLFETTAIGAGASGRNLGAIQHPFDAVLAPLYRASLEHYRGLAALDDGFALGAEPAGVLNRTWGVTVQLDLGAAAPTHVVEEDEVDAVNRPLVAEARAAASEPEADLSTLFTVAASAGVSTLGSTFLPREPDPAAIARLLIERGARYLPAIATAPVREIRVCARPQSVDSRPFIGPIGRVAGLFVCAGHGPWGISTGPASAELAVNAFLDGAPVPAKLAADRPI